VQVHYDEGVAIHIGPEPCVGAREGVGEASAGDRAGQAIEPRKWDNPGRRRRSLGGRQHGRARFPRAPGRPGVVEDPGMCETLLAREPGDLTTGPGGSAVAGPHREGEEP
jgi:hypothetical protein